jgi:uncharacterized membrane protein
LGRQINVDPDKKKEKKISYANATVVTFRSVILIFLIAVLSDALMMIISPMFINVFTLLKYPLAVTVANVSDALL